MAMRTLLSRAFAPRYLPTLGARPVASHRLILGARFASASAPPAPDTAAFGKAKPRAATALRRDAGASMLIRATPSPTRGLIRPVITHTTAERFALVTLRASLGAAAVPLAEAVWIPRWSRAPDAAEGEIFVFANGSFVCWGLSEADAAAFAADVRSRPGVALAALKEPETEELDFVTDPTEKTRLQGDLILLGHVPALNQELAFSDQASTGVLPAETLLARYAFSQALARSTALSAIEVQLEAFLLSVAGLPQSLAETGKPGLGRIDLIKKLGLLMQFRQGLNLNRENFSDTPDFYWAEPVLEGYFNSVSSALEMKARTSSVNDKITYAAEVQSTLRQLLTESSGHRMELIIIALIAVEVVLALIREGPELMEYLRGLMSPPALSRDEHRPT